MSEYIEAELRRLVETRARFCCEYCLIHQRFRLQTHHVDHIVARKHRGKTVESNLCLSCAYCNGFKGSDLASVDPETEDFAFLFHPRKDVWHDHFELEEEYIQGKTPKGRATVEMLRFNNAELVRERTFLAKIGLYP